MVADKNLALLGTEIHPNGIVIDKIGNLFILRFGK